eukprot:590834-Amphidinium_carterae.1
MQKPRFRECKPSGAALNDLSAFRTFFEAGPILRFIVQGQCIYLERLRHATSMSSLGSRSRPSAQQQSGPNNSGRECTKSWCQFLVWQQRLTSQTKYPSFHQRSRRLLRHCSSAADTAVFAITSHDSLRRDMRKAHPARVA